MDPTNWIPVTDQLPPDGPAMVRSPTCDPSKPFAWAAWYSAKHQRWELLRGCPHANPQDVTHWAPMDNPSGVRRICWAHATARRWLYVARTETLFAALGLLVSAMCAYSRVVEARRRRRYRVKARPLVRETHTP